MCIWTINRPRHVVVVVQQEVILEQRLLLHHAVERDELLEQRAHMLQRHRPARR
jgi:hypothetical protein